MELQDRLRDLYREHYLKRGATHAAYEVFMKKVMAEFDWDLQAAYIQTEFLFRPENCN
jgi:hypothetical protein